MQRAPYLPAALATLLALPAAAQSTGPSIAVDPTANRHPINPNIYGMAYYGLSPTLQAAARIPVLRWGGDGTTRYNWQADSSNAGFDWFFMSGDGNASPIPSASADALVLADQATASQTLLTIPIIPEINNSSLWNCSFPVQVYGAQQATNPYVFPNNQTCGNSIATNGAQLTDTNVAANNTPNSPAFQAQWLQHLIARFGTANTGGVRFYQLDNEPGGWSNTHRDVEPVQTTYPTIATLGESYATAIKQQDPAAQILGPSDFTLGGWIGTEADQNNLYAGQYYLQQMAAAGQTAHRRLLNYFDEHYYFTFTDPASQLASTRTLWDPTYNGGTWVEQYVFDGPMQLLPRFRSWIAAYYPGTKLAISEYSIDSGNKLITDALAEADVLGIFGWQALDFATMWSPPAPTDPIAFSFLLFRNYDGAGHGFGNTSVQATSTNQAILSSYAAATSTGGLTLVLINKTNAPLTTAVTIANATLASTAAMYSYSGADLTAIHKLAPVTFSANAATIPIAAYSMNMLVLKPGT